MRAFITGSRGSIGGALAGELAEARAVLQGWDILDGQDILDAESLREALWRFRPDVIFHLAGAKHAGSGEGDPLQTTRVNVLGTANVLEASNGARVITASTCKAADPETAYGSTKLLAERMTLNAGHSVARFYNVRESSGNVFELWEAIPRNRPVPVARCWRYFISLADATRLLRAVAGLPPGRYTVDPGAPRFMPDIAGDLGRVGREIAPRRGDRLVEPRCAMSETLEGIGDGIERIRSAHDEDVEHPRPDLLRAHGALRTTA